MRRFLALAPACVAAAVCLTVVAGCKLIDQTTFGAAPEAPSAAELAALPPVNPGPALLTIRYSTPDPSYTEQLRIAVDAAERQRAGAEYDVVGVVPASSDPAQQANTFNRARLDAAAVMRAMIQLGVPDTRLHLGGRVDPAIATREVRVYVR